MNTFPKGETALKVKPTMSEGFSNPLIFEGTKIDLGKLPDDDKINIEFKEQAKKKETSIDPASENIIFEVGVNEGEAEVDNMSMEGSSAINPAVSDHKDVNLYCEDNKAEGTKIKQLESKGESMDGNAEVIENGSSALY